MTRFHWVTVMAFLALCVALAMVRAAHAATGGEAGEAAWYLKGEGDVIFASQNRGMRVARLTCEATRVAHTVRCLLVVNQAGVGNFCSRGVFVVHGFAVDGQFTAPKKCHVTSGPPS